jgi:DNA polymerase-4
MGSRPACGVVAAASQEARAFGVHSMPMATAVRVCPTLVIVSPDVAPSYNPGT